MVFHANREKANSLLNASGIKDAPVDLDKIAEILGFQIIPYPFPDQRNGMIIVEGNIKAIGVNQSHPPSRQRYTIAHEIGHFVNGHEYYAPTTERKEILFYDHSFQQEREADAFAAELLMPKHFLEKDLSEIGFDIPKLIEKYKVSEQAMRIRLVSLKLVEKYAVSKPLRI